MYYDDDLKDKVLVFDVYSEKNQTLIGHIIQYIPESDAIQADLKINENITIQMDIKMWNKDNIDLSHDMNKPRVFTPKSPTIVRMSIYSENNIYI